MELIGQQNIGINVNVLFSMIRNNLAAFEQFLMSISDDSFFGYKKKVIVILDRIRPLSRAEWREMARSAIGKHE